MHSTPIQKCLSLIVILALLLPSSVGAAGLTSESLGNLSPALVGSVGALAGEEVGSPPTGDEAGILDQDEDELLTELMLVEPEFGLEAAAASDVTIVPNIGAYWYADQLQSVSPYTVYLSTVVTGEVNLRLFDSNTDQVIGASDGVPLNGNSDFTTYLQAAGGLPIGTYNLQAMQQGAILVPTQIFYVSDFLVPQITVTDQAMVMEIVEYQQAAGKYSAPGDSELLLKVTAFGVDHPEQLGLTLSDADGIVAQSTSGTWLGKAASGASEFLYQLTTEPEMILEQGVVYTIAVEPALGLSLLTEKHTFSVSSTYPQIYDVRVIDGAVGLVQALVQNLPADGYEAVLEGLSGPYANSTRTMDVSYTGGSVMELQFTDDDLPSYLAGDYSLSLNGNTTGTKVSTSFAVYYDDAVFGDRYEQTALLTVAPEAVQAGQIIDFSAQLANLGSGTVGLELVEMNAADGEDSPTPVTLTATATYDPNGYRFLNLYTVTGEIAIPAGLSADSDYRWRINCQNTAGEMRQLISNRPLQVITGPTVRQLLVEDALASSSHGQGGGPQGMQTNYVVGENTTTLSVVLQGVFGLANPSLVSVNLLDVNANVMGSLQSNSLVATSGLLSGQVNITNTLVAGMYSLVASYDGQLVASVGVTVIDDVAVGGSSLSRFGVAKKLACGQNFSLTLDYPLNIQPSKLQLTLVPVAGGATLMPTLNVQQVGSRMILTCQTASVLPGLYRAILTHDEQPLNVYVMDWLDPIPSVVVHFEEQALVTSASAATDEYHFSGINFSPTNNYQAVLHRASQPLEPLVPVDLIVRGSDLLILDVDDLNASWKGDFRVLVLENGQPLPLTQPLRIILQPSEQTRIPPIVSINNGVTFTLQQQVQIAISPGSYSQLRLGTDEAALASLPYEPIQASFEYTLSDGFGEKTLYLQFRDSGGNATSVTSAKIKYLSDQFPEPSGYGLSASTVLNGQQLTVWVKTNTAAQASCEFLDSAGNIISELTQAMKRTGLDYGVYTYSKTVTADADYRDVSQVILRLEDPVTKVKWNSPDAELPLTYEPQIFISRTQTDLQKVYYYRTFVRAESQIGLKVTGTPEMVAVAELIYSVGVNELKQSITLEENAVGVYTQSTTLPSAVERVIRVDYRLNSTNQGTVVSDEILCDVASSLQFSGLPNEGGAFTGKQLRLSRRAGWGYYQQSVVGNDPLTFANIEPATYDYYLGDSERVYASGFVKVAIGENNIVSLATTPSPATFTLTNVPAGVKGRVHYTITDVSNQVWDQYSNLGESLSGLVVGDSVRYQVYLDATSLKQYYQPNAASKTLTASATVEPVSLQPITMITLTGRVIDQAFNGQGQTVPVAGAVVYIAQRLDNAGMPIYNNQSATTDQDGWFSLPVISGVVGDLQVGKSDYQTAIASLDAQTTDHTLADPLELLYLRTGYISLALQLAPAELPDGELEFLPGKDNSVWIVSVKDGAGVNVPGGYYYYDSKFRFYDEQALQPGDQVTVKVQTGGMGLSLLQNEFTLTLDAHSSAQLVVQAISPGEIHVDATNVDNNPIHLLLFNQQGRRLIHRIGSSLFSTSEDRLAPGVYTVVLLSGDNLQRAERITSLTQLQSLALQDDVHFVQQQVTVVQGRVNDLTMQVPTITDELLGYLASEGTGISLTAADLVQPGKTKGTVTLRYAMPDRLYELGYGATYLTVSLPAGGSIVNRLYYLNGVKMNTPSDSTISVAVDGTIRTGVLRFDLELEQESQVEIRGTATIKKPASGSVTETIFDGFVDLPLLTINAPEEVLTTAAHQLELHGVGYAGQLVEINEGGTVIGKALTDVRGRWQTTVSLPNPLVPGIHQLVASMTVADRVLQAESSTRIVRSSAIQISEAVVWQPGRFTMNLGVSDDATRRTLSIYPYAPVLARFKLLNVSPESVDYAALANDYQGQTTLFPAVYQATGEFAGYWLVSDAYLYKPGTLSIVYSLRTRSDDQTSDQDYLNEAQAVAHLTNSQMIDVATLSVQPELDINTLPSFMQTARLVPDGSLKPGDIAYKDGADAGNISATLDLGSDRRMVFTGTITPLAADRPDQAGFTRIDTEQGHYWTSAPYVNVDEANGTIVIRRKVYFSQKLWDALNPPDRGMMRMAGAGEMQALEVVQDGLQVLEYTSTATGVAGDLYELSKGAGTLGNLGKGLQALGGVSLAGSALLGRMGLDPVQLRSSANLIVADELLAERDRIIGEIREYRAATEKSHYINTFMGGVSYVASFVGPVGKGLSYVVTTGGMAYSSSIGSEYETWGNAIISMIRSALEKQERIKLAKKKKLNDPNWKIDPSGYVFEGTEAERIKGVTATVLQQDGDTFRVWSEAAEWEEINPLQTDELGKYGWDVPEGEWKVRFEGAGYQTYETKSMDVPPLHDQVNIGLLATATPELVQVSLYADALELDFDRYMLPTSLTGNVVITDANGQIIPVKEIILINPVDNTGYTGTGDYSDIVISASQFAKSFRLIPNTPSGGFSRFQDDGETVASYQVRLLQSIASYAAIPLSGALDRTLTVAERQGIPLTVRANAQIKVYGTVDPALTYQIVAGALLGGDQLSGQLGRVAGENVGDYQINQGTLSGGDKYQITYQAAELTISKRPITVTATAKSKYVNSSDPTLNYQVTAGSLVTGDNFSGQLTRAAGEAIGTYEIRLGTLSAGSNYLLTFVPANLTVAAMPPADPGGSGDPGTPTNPTTPTGPEITVTTEGLAELALEGNAVSGDDGTVTAIHYTTSVTLVNQINSARAQGATLFDLRLGVASEDTSNLPRSLTIPADALVAAAEGEALCLSISTPAGTLTLPPALLDALAAQGQPLSMLLSRVEAATVGSLPVGASAVDLPLAVETNLTGRTMVQIPLNLQLPQDAVARAAFLRGLSIFAVHSDEQKGLIYDLQFEVDESLSPAMLMGVSFQVDQFSSFTLVKFTSEPLTTKVGVPGYILAGVAKDLPACYYQGSDTMMPLRMLESYGIAFQWDAATKTVTAVYRGKVVKLVISSSVAEINGSEQAIIGASGKLLTPVLVDGRVMLPLRFVSEVLSFQVHWASTHVITIRP